MTAELEAKVAEWEGHARYWKDKYLDLLEKQPIPPEHQRANQRPPATGQAGGEEWNEAAGVSCPKCGDPYEMVRPGKIQPSCACEYIARLIEERDEARADVESIRNAFNDETIAQAQRWAGQMNEQSALMVKVERERDAAIVQAGNAANALQFEIERVTTLHAERDHWKAIAEAGADQRPERAPVHPSEPASDLDDGAHMREMLDQQEERAAGRWVDGWKAGRDAALKECRSVALYAGRFADDNGDVWHEFGTGATACISRIDAMPIPKAPPAPATTRGGEG